MSNEYIEAKERASIPFPRPMGKLELEGLLIYLSKNVKLDSILYNTTLEKKIDVIDSSGEKKHIQKQELSLTVTGTAYGSFAAETFTCKQYDNNHRMVISLDFSPIVDYGIGEHRKEVVELWDSFRKEIGNYFSAEKNQEYTD